VLSRAAVAAGVDGVFMEVHDNPNEAKATARMRWIRATCAGLLKELQAVRKALDVAHATP